MTDCLSPTVCSSESALIDEIAQLIENGGDSLLRELLETSLIRRYDWEHTSDSERDALQSCTDPDVLLDRLISLNLLTSYQVERVRAGQQFGLVLGHYRVLCPLGHGSMGQVYKAEHTRLPKTVAIKVQALSRDFDLDLVRRFENEAWTVAQLQHRNIVGAIDAGEVVESGADGARLLYFVMEYIPGMNLEEMIATKGALPQKTACNIVFQAANALQEINKLGLIHRDIKPSNILVTPDGNAKLLDFGLSRQTESRLTTPGAWLGTVDYLAPEQAKDASSVDIRADIYSLGATLYWCLTGRTPFVSTGRVVEDFLRRSNQSPPSVLELRSDVSPDLDVIISKMMAVQPGDRHQTPASVMTALIPFMERRSEQRGPAVPAKPVELSLPASASSDPKRKHRVLVVDDEPTVRKCVRLSLVSEGIDCDEAINGDEALKLIAERSYDLVLTDIEMPVLSGMELISEIRNGLGMGHLKILVFSGRSSPNEMARMMSMGADDYLVKPLSIVQLRSRVNAALRLKESQDAAVALNQRLFEAHQVMAQSLSSLGEQYSHANSTSK